MAVLTLALQSAVSLAFLGFGLLGLAARHHSPGAPPDHRGGWLLVGGALTAHGTAMLLHSMAAFGAYFAGSGTALYEAFVDWTPAMNHSRTFLLVAFTLALLAHAVLPSARRGVLGAAAFALMAVGFLLGVLIGRVEEFSALVHFSSVATWDVIELVLLLAALFAALLTSRLDRYAWLALGIYAFSLALNVMWIAALSRRGLPGEWSPRPWMIHGYRLVLTLGMVYVAARRLQLARRGTPVGSLMEGPARRPSLVG